MVNKNQGNLTERLRRIKELRSSHEPAGITSAEPIPGDWPQRCQAFPASYAQSRLWFLHQLEPDLTAYHLPALWRLSGNLDLNALRLALADLIERHPTLRTSFRLQGSEVVQLIHPPAPFHLEPEALADRNPDAVIEQWLEKEYTTPFDFTSGNLIRARLLGIDHQHHLLLINHHHISSDGWSRLVLAQDLTELYNARRSGQPSALPPLRVHYHDYAAWQRQRLSGDRLQTLKDYWIPQLTGLEPLEIPTDHPRPATPSHRGASVSFQITPELLAPFEELCRLEGATLQMGLLALVALLLHRYSRQDDFAIGIPIWGRNHPDLEPLIGFFINTLPIRTRFTPQQSFRQLLLQVKASSLEAYDHQELPFEQMVEALNLERDTSRNPLVQVMLQLIELSEASLHSLEGLAAERVPINSDSSKIDLGFMFRRLHTRALEGKISYSLDIFKENKINRLADHLMVAIEEIPRSDKLGENICISLINILPSDEKESLLSWSHPTAKPEAKEAQLIHKFIKKGCSNLKDQAAVKYNNSTVSYERLFSEASSFASLLRSLGLHPGDRVAVLLKRGIELPIAILGCLEAGACYVPIDPESPSERINHIISDSSAKVLVGTQNTDSDPQSDRLFVSINYSDGKIATETYTGGLVDVHKAEANRHNLELTSSSAAYLLYTSGSTGNPKGVEVSHSAAVQMLDFRLKELTPPSVCGLSPIFGPVTFDATLAQILTPLAAGGTLLMLDSITAIKDSPLYQEVTCISGTPSTILEIILNGLLPPGISVIGLGAEPVSPELADQLSKIRSEHPSLQYLYIVYGLTEAGCFSTAYKLRRSSLDRLKDITNNIGRPIDGASIYILDGALNLCPAGVPGELHIGGDGLARGYLNNPELTAEKFIPDPFSSDPSARLYKSGDLASWNSDGTLAYHGRIDQQIKLRGFRIEPGEIEAHLLSHPAVAQSVVVLRHDDPNNPRLIAYWVADLSQPSLASSSSEQLRAFLADRLPDYMVPAAFLQLEALPLTPNGKLDRKALPAPSFSGNLEQRVEPSTDLERQLHAIWAEVLGHSDFGITDNFFAIGGHSLAAARLVSRIEQAIGSAPSLAALFQNPSIAGVALLAYGNSRHEVTESDQAIPAAVPILIELS